MNAALPIEVDPEIMSGAPVFRGTRVPVESLFDYLMKGSNLDEFLDCFPTVRRQDALLLLEHYKHEALTGAMIPSRTLNMLERSVAQLKKGKVSEPVDCLVDD